MRRRPTIGLAAALVAMAGVTGCAGCESGPVVPPERFVPAAADLAVIVPDLSRAAGEADAVFAAAAALPGAAALPQWRAAAAEQLGLDPLDRTALARAGIDPARGAALAWGRVPAAQRGAAPGRAAVLVLPVGDRGDLEDLLARLARDRSGATERTVERIGGQDVVVWRAPAGSPALAIAVRQRTALVAGGPAGPAAIAAAAALPSSDSLAESADFAALRRAIGDAPAIAFVPPGSPLVPAQLAGRAIAAGASGDASRFRLVAALPPGTGRSFADLAAPGGGGALARRLDPAAPVAASWSGDPAALGRRLVPLVSERDRAWLAARGLDLQRDVLDLLGPGAAGAVTLAPGASLAGVDPAALRADPVRVLRFEAVAPLRDPARALETSHRIACLAVPRCPAHPPAPKNGAVTFRVTTASGEIAWAVDPARARVAMAGGEPGRLAELLRRLDAEGAPGFRPPTEVAARALDGGIGGAALDVGRLVERVRAMPPEAFGEGPDAFVLRSLAQRLVEQASGIAAASARVDVADGVLRLTVELEAAPRGRAP